MCSPYFVSLLVSLFVLSVAIADEPDESFAEPNVVSGFELAPKTWEAFQWVLTNREQGNEPPLFDDSFPLLGNEDVAVLRDEAKTIVTDKSILLTEPIEMEKWRLLKKLFRISPEGKRGSLIARVFLESPEEDEAITFAIVRGAKIYFPRKLLGNGTANGTYHKINPGGFTGVASFSRGAVAVKAASPYHLPFEMEALTDPDGPAFLGEILLRRPPKQERATMHISLTDHNGNPLPWHFYFGPITFGGPYGKQTPLDENGETTISGLAAQSFLIGFRERMLAQDRTRIELKPGHIAHVKFVIDEKGELAEPDVKHEPIGDNGL